jgi:hypothetical protein
MRVETSGWAQPLAEAEGGPLLLAGQVGGQRIAILTFDLHASNLPLKISFPILMSNLMDWYAPARPFDAPDVVHPGDPIVIRAQAATTAYRVIFPDGASQTYQLGLGQPSFTATEHLGVYRIDLLAGEQPQISGSFAVNLFSPEESQIAPRDAIQIGQSDVVPGQTDEQYGEREFWPWLAVLALAVLLAEWWVYHRGSTFQRQTASGAQARRRWLIFPGRRL